MRPPILRPAPVGEAFDHALCSLVERGTPLLDIAITLGRTPVDIAIMFDAWRVPHQMKAAS